EPLLRFVLACLEKDPARRPSARGLLDLLRDAPAAGGPAALPAPADGGADAEVSPDGATRVQGAVDPTRVAPADAPGTRQYTELAPGEAGAPATRQYTRLAGEEHAASALAPRAPPAAPPT